MIYFTSDLHLFHANAIKFTDRPFKDVEDMNTQLIQNINATVGMNDELWILGDFSFKGAKEDVIKLRNQIICKNVHLVKGNHDKNYENDNVFQSVQDYKELKTDYGKIILFHYPIRSWNGRIHGTIHLHGHIHSTGEYNAENLANLETSEPLNRIYDVGVDANNYRPVSLEEIVILMKL